MSDENQETSADIIAEMRGARTEFPFVYLMGEPDTPEVIDCRTKKIIEPRKMNIRRVTVKELADRLEAALKREVDKLNSAIQATVGRSDAEIDRLRREIAEMRQAGDAAKLPDGWKMYDKYQIRHTDGTPLKGKRYFVLRLDSDDPLEAARVAAAMSAYKGETPQGDAAKLREACQKTLDLLMRRGDGKCRCVLTWDEFNYTQKMLRAAIDAPRRNCDVYQTSWDVVTHWAGGLDSTQSIVRMLDWLLAPAKGENDGSK